MAKKQCYVVLVGERPGIYASWAECEAQVKGWKGAKYKGFGKREEAEKYYNEYMGIAPAMEHKEQEATKSESCLENLIRDLEESNEDEEQDSLFEQLNAKIKESRQHPEAVLPSVEEFCHSYGYENFTSAQKRAVQAICGKNLLFAVPGSGKTTVLLARVGYLLHGRHGCKYCYANFNAKSVETLVSQHNPASPLLVGELSATDKVTERKMKSLRGKNSHQEQLSLF